MTNRAKIILSGYGAQLRLARESDLAKILKWRNSNHVRLMMKNSELIDAQSHFKWFESRELSRDYLFVYGSKSEDVGIIRILLKESDSSEAETGMYAGNISYLGDIINIGSILLAYDFCFEKLLLQRVRTPILRSNLTAIRLNSALGFHAVQLQDDLFDEYLLERDEYFRHRSALSRYWNGTE